MRSRLPGWPGDADTVAATRDNADALNDVGIADIVDHYAEMIDAGGKHEAKPVVVGHSFGGLIAQELLAAGHAAAAVAIDPAPIKGVQGASAGPAAVGVPGARQPGQPASHRLADRQAVPLRLRQRPDRAGVRRSCTNKWTIPGPGRPLFEDAAANFVKNSPAKVDTHLVDRGPLLLTSGTEDHTVPLKVTKEVFSLYAKGGSDTEFHAFEGRGHSLTIDSGWREVADVALDWLAAEGVLRWPI